MNLRNKHLDESFNVNASLHKAVDLLNETFSESEILASSSDVFSSSLPKDGMGEEAALTALAPFILAGAAPLDSPQALAHMDPPTPWITWATSMLNASLNQNVLHLATGPFARQAEQLVIEWLSPYFSMQGGHFCAGSTIANLTALWAARDAKGVTKVVASQAAHISVAKAAKILGLEYQSIDVLNDGTINKAKLGNLSNACLVLTAGTTSTGSIDDLSLAEHANAKWVHVDAAWAGPLQLSSLHRKLLDGIEQADSIAISAHKWLFQPKDSALILFKHADAANQAISMGSDYLVAPNVGVQGSRGASAVTLLATMLAWGEVGFAKRIDKSMAMATILADYVSAHHQLALWQPPSTGVTVFRPMNMTVEALLLTLPKGLFSRCKIAGKDYVRSVAANPNANIELILQKLDRALN